jgi:CRISPR-associated protein Cas2
MFILAAYDISNDKRLRRVAIIMENYGKRVQKSLFECLINEKLLSKMLFEIEQVIDKEKDSIRIYRLCNGCIKEIKICGKGEPTTDPDVYII